MIIVSQDKDRIFNFANIIYITANEKNEIVATTNWNDNADGAYELGQYATEERAKEVLQEIMEYYNSLTRKSVYAMGDDGFTFKEKFYYEMPEG